MLRSIIVIGAAIGCYVVFHPASCHCGTQVPSPAQDIRNIEAAVLLFKQRNNELPSSLEALVAHEYLRSMPVDPWDRPYNYSFAAPVIVNRELPYYLWSNGADGAMGGVGVNADIGNWHREYRRHTFRNF
ncbi:MAG: type II secretion system protein GspG [Pseudomonadota bacterium]